MFGISNVATFMRAVPPYWKPVRYEWATRVGDAENNATLNRIISPIFHADKIRAPLLIGQGANDVRVVKNESDQIFAAMKRLGLDVEYVVYPDEGHGLVRPANRLDFYARTEAFLQRHLGGRRGPALPRAATAASSAQVVTEVAGVKAGGGGGNNSTGAAAAAARAATSRG